NDVPGDLVGLDVDRRLLAVTGWDGDFEELGILGTPLKILEPHGGSAAGAEPDDVDADGQRRRRGEPDLDPRVRMNVVTHDGGPGNGETFGPHAPDFLLAGDRLGLTPVIAEAAEETE